MATCEHTHPCECATGLCEGTDTITGIVGTENPPGRSHIRYRLGTHGTFNQSMILEAASDPSLRNHTSRDSSSAMLAFLDINAYLLDILCLYNQLIANEGYLMTATERLSLLEMARSIGYELKPGVAASTYLAFDVQSAPGMPDEVIIEPGVQAQTIPLPDEELPQLFETVETVEGLYEWNAFAAKLTRTQLWIQGKQDVTIAGTGHNLAEGSRLLFLFNATNTTDNWEVAEIDQVEEDFVRKTTKYTFVDPLNIPNWLNDIETFNATAQEEGFSKWPLPDGYPKVLFFSSQATPYGSNAADWKMLPASSKKAVFGLEETVDIYTTFQSEWPNFVLHLPWEIASKYDDMHLSVQAEQIDWINLIVEITENSDLETVDVENAQAAKDAAQADYNTASNNYQTAQDDHDDAHEAYDDYWDLRIEFRAYGTLISGPLGTLIWDAVYVDNYGNGNAEKDADKDAYDHMLEMFDLLKDAEDVLNAAGDELIKQLEELELAQAEDEATRIAIVQSIQYYKSYRSNTLCLDQEYKDILTDSYVYLDDPAGQDLFKVQAVETLALSSFALSGKSSILTFPAANKLAKYRKAIRSLSVLAGSQELTIAEEIDPTSISGAYIRMDKTLPKLPVGRIVSLTGIDENSGEDFSRQLTVKIVTESQDEDAWIVEFNETIDESIQRETAEFRGNLVLSTHGRSSIETLGHGDARQRWVNLQLSHSPLTYMSSSTDPRGIESSLEVSVEGLKWSEVKSFYQTKPEDEVYTVKHADDGTTSVRFGDGVTGRRLPTGMNNIKARYRYELGSGGNLVTGRLINLMTRPLGLQNVHQPLISAGGEDPEERDDARDNAPITVKTLDRLVSLSDYADYAKAFAGIAKAHSAWGKFGMSQGVLLTIAGAEGAKIPDDSELGENFRNSLELYRDPTVPFKILNFVEIPFVIAAKLHYDERYEDEAVLASATEMLGERYGFKKMKLGEDVTAGAIVGMLQSIDGVIGVDLDHLYTYNDSLTLETQQVVPTEATISILDEMDNDPTFDVNALYNGGADPISAMTLGDEVSIEAQQRVNEHLNTLSGSGIEEIHHFVSHPSQTSRLAARVGYIDKFGVQFPAELLTLDSTRLSLTAVPTAAYQL